jgi:hypothetical protein
MIWLYNRDDNDAFEAGGASQSQLEGVASPPSTTDSFVLVKALDPVRMRIDDQELLYLTRVTEDFSRNSMVRSLSFLMREATR